MKDLEEMGWTFNEEDGQKMGEGDGSWLNKDRDMLGDEEEHESDVFYLIPMKNNKF